MRGQHYELVAVVLTVIILLLFFFIGPALFERGDEYVGSICQGTCVSTADQCPTSDAVVSTSKCNDGRNPVIAEGYCCQRR